jgi:hypothetical protein
LADIGTPDEFLSHGFKAHLQCASGFDDWLGKYVAVKCIDFGDGAPIPFGIFREGQAWLSDHWDAGHKILISCSAGESRSVAMAIGLVLMKEQNGFSTACHEVFRKVMGAYPHPAILTSVARHCGAKPTFDELRHLYDTITMQPPFPWTDDLLVAALK